MDPNHGEQTVPMVMRWRGRRILLLLAIGIAACRKGPPVKPGPCVKGDQPACQAHCDEGDFQACEILGAMYAFGQGVAQDQVMSANLLGRACRGGNKSGCVALAVSYWEGTGVERNDQRARELIESSCAHGAADACGEFGNLYYIGLGLPKNQERGQYLLTLGCEAGDAPSCQDLALILHGQGSGGR
jgi:TPR repeat protein